MHHVLVFFLCLGLSVCVGCSTLGFPTTPVAHTLTEETKDVLMASPRAALGVPRELNKQALSSYFLQPGDELLIEPVSFESQIRVPADQQVAADGSIDLGAYGRIIAVGQTLEQVEQAIDAAIATNEQQPARVNVRLVESVQRYYVIGEVNSPGAYPLVGHETVLDAIMAAGGLTLRASACDLLLARPTDPCSCRVTLPVCYRAITQLGDTTTNYQLKPGDRVFVGRQSTFEELMQCCCIQKQCDRCCNPPRACRDPSIATNLSRSDFLIPIDPVAVNGPHGEAVDSVLVEGVPVDQQSVESEMPAPAPKPAGNKSDASTDRLDGELDFDRTPG